MAKNYVQRLENVKHYKRVYYDGAGKEHRLDGPAIVTYSNAQLFFIHGVSLLRHEWEEHPEVIEFKRNDLIKRLLND